MILGFVFFGLASCHMDMVSPAPRRSPHNNAYTGALVDYDMTSPLGAQFPYPCRGYGAGPVVGTYEAGSTIPVTMGGGANHNGGHCQWSLSYDDVNFASIKTVMGTCMLDTLNYQVTIPHDAPNGKATLAWSWINRTGNREYYMNCADIDIKGRPDGKIVGPRMLVADLPGFITFPEGFSNDYGMDIYASQPTITVAPHNQIPTSPPYPIPTPSPHAPQCRPRH
ncbi:hypothetical protein DSO57_1001195 [Entomophthora muscae]|uniref:Uncharacterized protein n=2 Tax=Entomophthora muscae TaxID=34485 RepID=A0ACC2TWJ8_9FUNG|nr:hypothetical protein DSO57_1007034 [Entomophthora muscae]KAJ9078982.1 hypothetical protein DSO57_1001195 [Entomophthora muscae]